MENMGDYDNIIHTAQEEAEKRGLEKGLARGRAEGLAEGLAEGHAEAQVEIARKMLASGMTVEQTAQLTGLAVDEVKELQ